MEIYETFPTAKEIQMLICNMQMRSDIFSPKKTIMNSSFNADELAPTKH